MSTFVEHVEAFAAVLPKQLAPLILDLASVPWPDDTTRDQFITDLNATTDLTPPPAPSLGQV